MVTVIGSGVSGCYAAEKLSEQHSVKVFERKNNLHKTCSGILTYKIDEILQLKKQLIQTKIHDVHVHAPNKKVFSLRLKKPDIVLHRKEFVQWLKDRAISKGAEFYEEQLFEKLDRNTVTIKDLKTGSRKNVVDDYFIGADGALSRVATSAGIYGKREFFTAIKMEVKCKHDGGIHFYPNIKDFAWTNPVNEEVMEIGICARKNPMEVFTEFSKIILQQHPHKILRQESALIPLYNPKQVMHTKNVFLVGDAATINKPTSGGGIIFGLQSSQILGEAFATGKQNQYTALIKKKIGKELWMHTKIRKVMEHFSDKDWNTFIEYSSSPKIQKLLETQSRDYPLKMVGSALLQEPRFLYFAKYLGSLV